MEKVDITIVSTVKNEEGEEKTEFFTCGEYGRTENGYSFSYEENAGMGYEDCTVCVSTTDSGVTIERRGPASSTMSIEKNVKHHCIYSTPYGDLTMGINTYEIENGFTDDGGRLYFRYSIDINSGFISENEMEITVKRDLHI